MDGFEYAQRVGAKVQKMLEEGTPLTWPQMVEKAGDEVMAEEEDAS